MASLPPDLSGSVALVTGAAKRIGRAIALALAGRGARVIVHYRSSADEARDVVEQIGAAGGAAACVQADLADTKAARGLMDRAAGEFGPVDILVNSASIFPADGLTDFTAERLYQNVNVNALSPLLLGRALAAQGRDGQIVNLLDCRIVDYDREHAAYHLSKRMLFTLTRMMALEFAPRIRVNAVAPGLILPPPGLDEGFLERMASTNPLGRHGDVSDIANAVLFLVGSDFVTGQVIYVDGGRHMRGSVYG
ncbi:MAG: SDR family oxidoreductase [Planctomycetota bacterium]|jgi:NAD(P)-dependent dehydrogenase (short-subunit alcohol dehydrogenase family)